MQIEVTYEDTPDGKVRAFVKSRNEKGEEEEISGKFCDNDDAAYDSLWEVLFPKFPSFIDFLYKDD
jgi:hypothetical protein